MRLPVAILLLSGTSAVAEGTPYLADVTGVAAGDLLHVRAAPDAGAETLGTLPPDADGVEVVALAPGGGWAQVNAGEVAGWAASRYLAPVPGSADWWAMDGYLECAGTEPFWSVAIGADRIAFAMPDVPAADMAVTARWPGSAPVPVAGVQAELDGGTATVVLQAAACSDGMSDRAYGIGVTALLSGLGPTVPLRGCCTLAP